MGGHPGSEAAATVDNGWVSTESSAESGVPGMGSEADPNFGTDPHDLGLDPDPEPKPGSRPAAEPADAADRPAPRIPRRRVGVVALVAVLALGLDILTKTLVVAHLEGREPVKLLGGLVWLVVFRNPGAAFSMATGMTWILSLVALAVVVAIVWIAPRLRSVGWAIGLGLVLAGALGNLVDRIFRAPGPMLGHVVDFISLRWNGQPIFAIFNVADSCICVGGALIVLLAAFGRDYDGGLGRRRKARTSGARAE